MPKRIQTKQPAPLISLSPAQKEELTKYNAHAHVDFNRLVDKGCDPIELWDHLQLLKKPPFLSDDWKQIFRMQPRQVRQALARIKKCADDISRLNTYKFRLLTNFRKGLEKLPDLLREFISEVETILRNGGPQQHPALNTARCLLVQYVKDKTGKFYDKEVSSLIRVDYYSHGMWRRKNCRYTVSP